MIYHTRSIESFLNVNARMLHMVHSMHTCIQIHTYKHSHAYANTHAHIQTLLNFDMVLNQEPSESDLDPDGNKFPPCSSS